MSGNKRDAYQAHLDRSRRKARWSSGSHGRSAADKATEISNPLPPTKENPAARSFAEFAPRSLVRICCGRSWRARPCGWEGPFGVVQLLIPMVTDVTEIINGCAPSSRSTQRRGSANYRPRIKLGAMIETFRLARAQCVRLGCARLISCRSAAMT